MAALCHGLPMILTPIGADQPFHADRCRARGVALIVEESEVTPQRMRVAFEATGPLPVDHTFDNGFQLMASMMVWPKSVQLYTQGSHLFGHNSRVCSIRETATACPRVSKMPSAHSI